MEPKTQVVRVCKVAPATHPNRNEDLPRCPRNPRLDEGDAPLTPERLAERLDEPE